MNFVQAGDRERILSHLSRADKSAPIWVNVSQIRRELRYIWYMQGGN